MLDVDAGFCEGGIMVFLLGRVVVMLGWLARLLLKRDGRLCDVCDVCDVCVCTYVCVCVCLHEFSIDDTVWPLWQKRIQQCQADLLASASERT